VNSMEQIGRSIASASALRRLRSLGVENPESTVDCQRVADAVNKLILDCDRRTAMESARQQEVLLSEGIDFEEVAEYVYCSSIAAYAEVGFTAADRVFKSLIAERN